MNVIYKCRCMRSETTLFVRDRLPEEEVVHWVERVCGHAIAIDHRTRSPLCRATRMDYMKIPVDDDDQARIGNLRRS